MTTTRSLTSALDCGGRTPATAPSIKCAPHPVRAAKATRPFSCGTPVHERKAHSDAGDVRAAGCNAARLARVRQPRAREKEGNGGFRREIRCAYVTRQPCIIEWHALITATAMTIEPTRISGFIRVRCTSALLAGRQSVSVSRVPAEPLAMQRRLTDASRVAVMARLACGTVQDGSRPCSALAPPHAEPSRLNE